MRKRKLRVAVDTARWAAYTTAGLATAFCGSSVANADLHIVEPNVQLNDPEPGNGYWGYAFTATFGMPGASLVFQHAYSETGFPSEGILAVRGRLSSNAPSSFRFSVAASPYNPFFYGSNLAYGQNLSSLNNWASAGQSVSENRVDLAWAFGCTNSQFLNQSGYIGFRFDVGNGTQYGWAELRLDSGVPANIYTLTSMGWGDPGDAVIVGPPAIPEPGSLGLLAMGAAGLITWRRNRR